MDVENLDAAVAFPIKVAVGSSHWPFPVRRGRWVEMLGGSSPIYLLAQAGRYFAESAYAAVCDTTAVTGHRFISISSSRMSGIAAQNAVAAGGTDGRGGAKVQMGTSSHPERFLSVMGCVFVQWAGKGYGESRVTIGPVT